MATIYLHQMTREQVMIELDTHYHSLLSETIEYCKATTPNGSKEAYEEIARELIYQECVKSFNFNDHVTSAREALERVSNGPFYKLVCETLQKLEQERILEMQRVTKLKEKCCKKGLDFDKENEKYFQKKAKKEKIRATKGIKIALVEMLISIIFTLVVGVLCIFGGEYKAEFYIGLVLSMAFFISYIIEKIKYKSRQKS